MRGDGPHVDRSPASFRVSVSGVWVPGSGFRVSGFGFRGFGFGFRVSGSVFRSYFVFRVSGSGFRVSCFVFQVSGSRPHVEVLAKVIDQPLHHLQLPILRLREPTTECRLQS